MDSRSALIVLAGAFTFVCSALNLRFFMANRKALRLASLLGHTGARVFYMLAGLALVALGLAGSLW